MIQNLSAKIKNLFVPAAMEKRLPDGSIRVMTAYGSFLEGKELFPYGFFSKALSGTVNVLCPGGNYDSFILLPVASASSPPALSDGDAVLWTASGGFVIARNSGNVEINGTNLGGAVIAGELQAQLEKNNQILQAIKQVLSVPVNEPGGGSPSAFQAALNAAVSSLPIGSFDHIENEKVKHGNAAD